MGRETLNYIHFTNRVTELHIIHELFTIINSNDNNVILRVIVGIDGTHHSGSYFVTTGFGRQPTQSVSETHRNTGT